MEFLTVYTEVRELALNHGPEGSDAFCRAFHRKMKELNDDEIEGREEDAARRESREKYFEALEGD